MKKQSVALCGHTKCGTRWLAKVVQSNPNLRYVHWSEVSAHTIKNLADEARHGGRPLFIDYPGAISSDAILDRLNQIDPDMKAILIYRNPVDILLSKHNYSRPAYGTGVSAGPNLSIVYDKFVDDSEFVASALNGLLRQVYEGEYRYDVNATRLRTRFQQFAEFSYDQLENDPAGFLSGIFAFCGVPATYKAPKGRIHRSLAFRSHFFHRVSMKLAYLATGVDTRIFLHTFADGHMKRSLLRFFMIVNDKPTSFLSERERRQVIKMMEPMLREFM